MGKLLQIILGVRTRGGEIAPRSRPRESYINTTTGWAGAEVVPYEKPMPVRKPQEWFINTTTGEAEPEVAAEMVPYEKIKPLRKRKVRIARDFGD